MPIQLESIPRIAMGSHLIAQAQGGAGKTVAFTIGMLSHIDTTLPYTQGLIVGMTRELARQIYTDAVVVLGKYMSGLTHGLYLAGFRAPQGSKGNQHIAVGTPGKLDELLFEKRYLDISKLRVWVLDEADELVMNSEDAGDSILRVTQHKKLSVTTKIIIFFCNLLFIFYF